MIMKLSTYIALLMTFIFYSAIAYLTFGDLYSHFCIEIHQFCIYLPEVLFYMVKTYSFKLKVSLKKKQTTTWFLFEVNIGHLILSFVFHEVSCPLEIYTPRADKFKEFCD